MSEYNNQSSPNTFYTLGNSVVNTNNSSSVETILNNGVSYQRYFYVNNVYRDSNGNVTSTASGNFNDPSTKQITVVVNGVASSTPLSLIAYVTRNNGTNVFDQKNWSGGVKTTASSFVSSTYAHTSSTVINTNGNLQVSTSTAVTPTQIQKVQVNHFSNSAGVTVPLPQATQAGDTIIVGYMNNSRSDLNPDGIASDPANGTYLTAASTTDIDNKTFTAIDYMPNAAVATSVNISVQDNFASWGAMIYEYSGIKSSGPLDQAVATGTTYGYVSSWSDPLTTTASGDLLIGVGYAPDPMVLNTSTFASDWYPNAPSGAGPIFSSAIAGSAGTYPFQGTSANNGRVDISAASFSPAASASSTGASGTLDSEPFDTNVISGAQLNSFVWQGSQPSGTSVKFQFAVSNTSSGPWAYMGPDGSSNTYFTNNPGIPINFFTGSNGYSLFGGYRYFSYRTFLYTSSTSVTPVINEVSVNWSP